MKMLEKICKSEAVSILKLPSTKQYIKKNQEFLQRYHIQQPLKEDLHFFTFEMIVNSLLNKEKIEEAFLLAYDSMHDYWHSLVYTEKNHLIQVELNPLYAQLCAIRKDNKACYIPIFDERMNHIYAHEMNLFELKQYDKLRFDLSSLTLNTNLTTDAIRFGFTSLQFIETRENNTYAYCSYNHTLYVIQDQTCQKSYAFERCDHDLVKLMELILLLEKEDEIEILSFLVKNHWFSEKHEKKCEKYLFKLLK